MLQGIEGSYCGPPPIPADLWLRWNFDPLVIATILLLAILIRRHTIGLAAVLILAVVFVSPLCALTVALFSARVVHHLLLISIAAPLLASAWPSGRSHSPVLSFSAATATLWIWHIPAAYDLALGSMLVYWVMQVSLFGTAVAMWRAILDRDRAPAVALIFILASYMQMALLGALLTFAPDQLYAIHAIAPMNWGLTPLADQQLGGLIMWVPAGIPYLVIGALVARRGWRSMGQAA